MFFVLLYVPAKGLLRFEAPEVCLEVPLIVTSLKERTNTVTDENPILWTHWYILKIKLRK